MTLVSKIVEIVSQGLGSPSLVLAFSWLFGRRRQIVPITDAKKILVLKPDEIGDFILAVPMLRALRQAVPNAKIILVVKPDVLNLAETCPYADRILEWNWVIKTGRFRILRCQWRAIRFAFSYLRRERFDVALIARFDADTYQATQLANYGNAACIIAYSETVTAFRKRVNRGYDRLVSRSLFPVRRACHEVEANLFMLQLLGLDVTSSNLEVWLTDADRMFAEKLIPHGGKYIAIGTGASKEFKRWAKSNFEQLASWLSSHLGYVAILLGGKDDPQLDCSLNLLGRTTLRQAAACISRCDLYIGNDSGLKHLAAAMHVPVVEISPFRIGGPPEHASSPTRFSAWAVKQRVVQPGHGASECAIQEVSVSSVKKAVEELFGELGP